MIVTQPRIAQAPDSTRLTVTYFLGYGLVGLLSAVLGPSMQTFLAMTGSPLRTLAILFTADAFGSVCGSLIAGRLLNRIGTHVQVAVGLVAVAVVLAAIPLLRWPVALAVLFWALGLAKTFVFVTVNTLLLWVRRAKVGPFINAADFFLGAGSLVMPLMIGLSITWTGDVRLAYWLVCGCAVALTLWVLRTRAPRPESEQRGKGGGRHHLMIGGVAVLLFLYVGAEISISGWLPSFVLLRGLTDDAATAAYFTSLFWIAVTVGRLLWVPFAQRLHPAVIVASSTAVCALAVAVIVNNASSVAVVTAGVVVVGLGMSSIFPSAFAMLARRVEMTGMVSGVCLCAASLGAMFFPWLVGQALTTP
ncbi:MFS transporter [Micromonospora sp. NPDC002575]|uniref:MFS transporter n=1 Tax=Micromonospora sp. NPDC002575 TaxID=3364222 RepID=UPI0036C4C65E